MKKKIPGSQILVMPDEEMRKVEATEKQKPRNNAKLKSLNFSAPA